MSPDFWDKLPAAAVWIVGVLVVGAMIIQRLAEASESFAKLISLGHWLHQRAEKRKSEELQREQVRVDRAVQLALDTLTPIAFKDLERQIKRQNSEIAGLYTRVSKMEATEDLTRAFLVEDAEWHVRVEIEFAEQQGPKGYTLPSRKTYTEFARKYREDRGKS